MKKMSNLLIVFVLYFVAGCSDKYYMQKLEHVKEIEISYGFSNYIFHSEDKSTINDLINLFEGLKLKKLQKKLMCLL